VLRATTLAIAPFVAILLTLDNARATPKLSKKMKAQQDAIYNQHLSPEDYQAYLHGKSSGFISAGQHSLNQERANVKEGDTHISATFMLAPGTPTAIANEAMKILAGELPKLRSTTRAQGNTYTSPSQPGDRLWGMLYPSHP
jgi:hypothetical protein